MRAPLWGLIGKMTRLVSLVLLALLGTVVLMRYAPGYFSDTKEMDAQYGMEARAVLDAERVQQGSLLALTAGLVRGWVHGDLGQSRQYGVPVQALFVPRVKVSARLLTTSIASGWLLAFALALPLSARRNGRHEALLALPSSLLLAVPVGAIAIGCMISGVGGPVLLLTTLVAARDFKFLYRLLRQAKKSPYLLYAVALGIGRGRVIWKHLLPPIAREMGSLGMMSLVLALSALVPVEVIFDVPGLGQMAWSAAMNRDLPVLLSVTMVMAACIALAGMLAGTEQQREATGCA